MLKESIASRYSEALFELAKERAQVDTVVHELDEFVALLSDPELGAFFDSPVVEREAKQALLRSALEHRVSELTLHFILLLVRKRRENLIAIVAQQMHGLLDAAAGRKVAAVATPAPLAGFQLRELAERLSAVYQATIVPQTKVAPELLGGLVVQVGDRYVDASVSGKLEELRRHLLASADTWGAAYPNGKSKGS